MNFLSFKIFIFMFAAYNEWREWCGLSRATSFDTLYDIEPEARQKLKQIYR